VEYLQRNSRPLGESQKDWPCSTGRYDETQPSSYWLNLPLFCCWSIPCHTHEVDTGDLAMGIEADKKAGRIAAWEDELY